MNPAVAPSPIAVDISVFTVTEADLKVLLVRRQAPPFAGTWALPGDAVDLGDMGRRAGEHIEGAAQRVLQTTTGLPGDPGQLHQVRTFGRTRRDPRGRVASVTWLARLCPDLAPLVGLRRNADWFSVAEEVPWMRLALDHAEILAAAQDRLRAQATEPQALLELVPARFTVAELQAAESTVLDRSIDARAFRRRFDRWVSEGLIGPAPGKRHLGRARPARVWRATCRIPGHPAPEAGG